MFAGIFGGVFAGSGSSLGFSCLFVREELGGCSEGCSFAREIYGCRKVSSPFLSFAIVRVCFLNSSEFGLFAREELGGCSEGWEELEVARKVAHLLGRFMVLVSQFPLSVIAIFIYCVLSWLVFQFFLK